MVNGERPKIPLPLKVEIKNTDPNVFKLMLKCIYSDKVEIDVSTISDLIKIAHKYQIEKLQLACADYMEKDVTVDNACELFEMGPKILGDENFGLSFIRENTDDVLQSDAFLKLSPLRLKYLLSDDQLGSDESTLFVALKNWAKAQLSSRDDLKGNEQEKIKEILKDYVQYIRFPCMDLDEIAMHVGPANVLSEKQMLQLYSFCALETNEQKEKFHIDFPIQQRSGGKKLKFTTINDQGGLFYFLGTGEGKKTSYSNPVLAGQATVTQSSRGGVDPYNIADRNLSGSTVKNSYGSDSNPWLAVKFSESSLRITELVICQEGEHVLQNWRLEGKNDKTGSTQWTTLGEFKNDTTLSSQYPPRGVFKFKTTKFFNEFRIYVTGPSNKGASNYDITQVEFYGYYRRNK